MLAGFFFSFFLLLGVNHRVFACAKAISWAPTDCDTQAEEVETTLSLFLFLSFFVFYMKDSAPFALAHLN
jgi:hypothetical protein